MGYLRQQSVTSSALSQQKRPQGRRKDATTLHCCSVFLCHSCLRIPVFETAVPWNSILGLSTQLSQDDPDRHSRWSHEGAKSWADPLPRMPAFVSHVQAHTQDCVHNRPGTERHFSALGSPADKAMSITDGHPNDGSHWTPSALRRSTVKPQIERLARLSEDDSK